MWAEYVAGVLLVVGSFFALMASIGLLRLKDVYMRMHAASKAGTVGSGLMMLALAIHAGELDVFTRAVAGIFFIILTAPVSAHLLARAAFIVGYRPCAETKTDAFSDMLRPDDAK